MTPLGTGLELYTAKLRISETDLKWLQFRSKHRVSLCVTDIRYYRDWGVLIPFGTVYSGADTIHGISKGADAIHVAHLSPPPPPPLPG